MIKRENGITDTQRPYEKCLRFGASSLTDAELLAVIIRTGTRGCDSVQLASKILSLSEGGIGGLTCVTIPEMLQLDGIGEVKAIQISCIGELSRRIASAQARKRVRAADPATVADYYMEQLRHDEQENIICMMLDTRNHIIGEERIARGTVDTAVLSTRDLFLSAMRFRAVSIILIHNHPSGDPTPSDEDIELTERIASAGELLDIRLLDHVIIGDCCYVSFLESRLSSSFGSDYVQ